MSGIFADNCSYISVSTTSYFAQLNRILLRVFLLIWLSTLLIACSSAPATPATTKAPIPTSVPPGTLLYQSNWSLGLDSWHATRGWKQLGKNLQTEPLDNLAITVPYQPKLSAYAFEVQLQIVHVAENGGYVSITADKQPGRDGYKAGVQNLLETGIRPNGSHPQVQAYIDPFGSMERESFETSDYEPGTQWHTFRVEVRDSQVSFFIDAKTISNATSIKTNFLSDGPLHLTGSKVILRVGTLRITTL